MIMICIIIAILTLSAPKAVALSEWGPSRSTYDYNARKGSSQGPVFNSFINLPKERFGLTDERYFVEVSLKDYANWSQSVDAVAGDIIRIKIYVDNDANDKLSDAAYGEVGIARNTRVRISIPNSYGQTATVIGYVSADNAVPSEVYASATVRGTSKQFTLEYVPDSAVIYNNGLFDKGQRLSDAIMDKDGVLIGYSALDGNLPSTFSAIAVICVDARVVEKSSILISEDDHRAASSAIVKPMWLQVLALVVSFTALCCVVLFSRRKRK